MEATTYTVTDSLGYALGSGLTMDEAVWTVLTYDGANYRLDLGDDGWWTLCVKDANGPWYRTVLSFDGEHDYAWSRIMHEIVRGGGWGLLGIFTDAEFAQYYAAEAEKAAWFGVRGRWIPIAPARAEGI